MGYKIAVVGATGNVGREMLNTLEERAFPADEVFALASSRSVGRELDYGDKEIKVVDAATFDSNEPDAIMIVVACAVVDPFVPGLGRIVPGLTAINASLNEFDQSGYRMVSFAAYKAEPEN